MRRIAGIVAAATVLAAVAIVASWMMPGGTSTSIAFAQVVEALDSRSDHHLRCDVGSYSKELSPTYLREAVWCSRGVL